MHNVPTGFMSEAVGKHIGNDIFNFLEYNVKNNFDFWRVFMRIRVLVDVRNPLKKQVRLRKPGGEEKDVKLKYERLEIFCYLCGLLGHLNDQCDKLFEMEVDNRTRGWGPKLWGDARMGSSGGGGQWLRDGSQPNWTPPSQAINAYRNFSNQDPKNSQQVGDSGKTLAPSKAASNSDINEGVGHENVGDVNRCV